MQGKSFLKEWSNQFSYSLECFNYSYVSEIFCAELNKTQFGGFDGGRGSDTQCLLTRNMSLTGYAQCWPITVGFFASSNKNIKLTCCSPANLPILFNMFNTAANNSSHLFEFLRQACQQPLSTVAHKIWVELQAISTIGTSKFGWNCRPPLPMASVKLQSHK